MFQFTAQQYKSSCWAIVERAGLWQQRLLRLAFGAKAGALSKTDNKLSKVWNEKHQQRCAKKNMYK